MFLKCSIIRRLCSLLFAVLSMTGPSALQAGPQSYMGRELAAVMGPGGIDWLERESRESEEKISQLIKTLPLKPGMNVADIGAGSGTLSRLMAPALIPGGTVLAVDIQKEMLDALLKKAKAQGIKNIKPVLGTDKDPKLAAASIDLVLMVDVYHEFSHPFEMLLAISKALRPGSILALVEYRGEDLKLAIKAEHKMTLEQIKKEFSLPELKLKWKALDSSLPRQHLVFFTKQ